MDVIGDMLTRIRNASNANKKQTSIPYSKYKTSVLDVLAEEGYIYGYTVESEEGSVRKNIIVDLKYHAGQSTISEIKRVSRPGLRSYVGYKDIPYNYNGLGIYIVSTSHGVMTDHQARTNCYGGELLCKVF